MRDSTNAAIHLGAVMLALLLPAVIRADNSTTQPAVLVHFDKGTTNLIELKLGKPVLTDRPWAIKSYPAELDGLIFTKRHGGNWCPVQIDAQAGATVYVLVTRVVSTGDNSALKSMADAGWIELSQDLVVENKEHADMAVFKKTFDRYQRVEITDNAEYGGYLVAARNLTLDPDAISQDEQHPATSKPGSAADSPLSRELGRGPSVRVAEHDAPTSNPAENAPIVQIHFERGGTILGRVKIGALILTNRNCRITSFPSELEGMSFTQREGGNGDQVGIRAGAGATVYVLLTRNSKSGVNSAIRLLTDAGWTELPQDLVVDNKIYNEFAVFKRTIAQQELLEVPPNSEWCGYFIAARNLMIGATEDEGAIGKAAEDWPSPPSGFSADSPGLQKPVPGPFANVNRPQTSIRILEVNTSDTGLMSGQTSEAVLTILRGRSPHLVSLSFVTPVGQEMHIARDEAMRYIHVNYPNWLANGAELTFEDKYSLHEGGSIGAALGTLVSSLIQGFEIDPNVAITGDITANGRVIQIGGVFAKIHGAEDSKCTIVALPVENFDQLVNTEDFIIKSKVPGLQVIGISTLDDAIAVVRTDRNKMLQQAIDLYSHVQQQIAQNPAYLHEHQCAEELTRVLILCPQHFSAKLELMLAINKQPATLSPGSSMYYTLNAIKQIEPILKARKDIGKNAVPSSAVHHGLVALAALRPKADPSVVPLIDAWIRFIHTVQSYESGVKTIENLEFDANAVDDEMAKWHMNADLMQKTLKDGI